MRDRHVAKETGRVSERPQEGMRDHPQHLQKEPIQPCLISIKSVLTQNRGFYVFVLPTTARIYLMKNNKLISKQETSAQKLSFWVREGWGGGSKGFSLPRKFVPPFRNRGEDHLSLESPGKLPGCPGLPGILKKFVQKKCLCSFQDGPGSVWLREGSGGLRFWFGRFLRRVYLCFFTHHFNRGARAARLSCWFQCLRSGSDGSSSSFGSWKKGSDDSTFQVQFGS